MEGVFQRSTLITLLLTSILVHESISLPVKSDIMQFEKETEAGMTEIQVDGADEETMTETIKSLQKQLQDFDLKALYRRRVVLEKLINDTDCDISQNHAKYIVTREEKIFFFTDGAPNGRPKGMRPKTGREFDDEAVPAVESTSDGAAHDTESRQLEDLIDLAKKHTRNPPDLRAKKSSVGAEAGGHPSVVSPFDLSAAHTDTEVSHKQQPNSVEMQEMIYALQQYVDKLKSQQGHSSS